MPDGLYVVVVLEVIEQLAHLGHILFLFEGDVVLRNHLDLRLDELVAELLQRLTNGREIVRRGIDLEGLLVSEEVLCACVERLHHDGVLVEVALLHDDNALLVELPGYAAGSAQTCAVLVEQVTNVRYRAVLVIGQGLNNDCNAADAVALVVVCLVIDLAVRAGILIERALDVVVRHIVCLCLCDAVAQTGVEVRVCRTAFLDRDRHFTADLGEDLGLLCIVSALALCDVVPFRMSRHG